MGTSFCLHILCAKYCAKEKVPIVASENVVETERARREERKYVNKFNITYILC